MGIYLSTPSSEIFTEEGACCTGPLHIKYAVGEMQVKELTCSTGKGIDDKSLYHY